MLTNKYAKSVRSDNNKFRSSVNIEDDELDLSLGIKSFSLTDQFRIIEKIRYFDGFDKTDLLRLNDIGAIDFNGLTIFWEIEYNTSIYDHKISEPSNLEPTNRRLSVMCL